MKIVNLSSEPEAKLRSWLPHALDAEQVVFFPDACPGRSPLPTGTATHIVSPDWRRFAVSDCGCGMRLLRSAASRKDLTQSRWDELARVLQRNKGQLGDLGSGNHFLDALEPYDSETLYFLIHTGSRDESGLVDDYVEKPGRFEEEFHRVRIPAKARSESEGFRAVVPV
jgi:hypothetical protein